MLFSLGLLIEMLDIKAREKSILPFTCLQSLNKIYSNTKRIFISITESLSCFFFSFFSLLWTKLKSNRFHSRKEKLIIFFLLLLFVSFVIKNFYPFFSWDLDVLGLMDKICLSNQTWSNLQISDSLLALKKQV
jgi:hypothetical protein